MDFGPDKRYWYGNGAAAGSGGPMAINGAPCSPISADGCAAGMPMYTKSSNTGVNVKAEMNLDAKNLLRVGGLYQHYTLDDWWPPSGAACGPASSTTSTTARATARACSANGSRASTGNG
jgi:iron complex outermembrane receptor protein